MTRLSVALPDQYPRKFIWWMECDRCQETRSEPTWTQNALPLSRFAADGWHIGKLTDLCPVCISKGEVPA